jgi:hypothetical protein
MSGQGRPRRRSAALAAFSLVRMIFAVLVGGLFESGFLWLSDYELVTKATEQSL